MFILAIFWSIFIYLGWCNQQVLTTITTTGKQIIIVDIVIDLIKETAIPRAKHIAIMD
jgi:hypothetical protein